MMVTVPGGLSPGMSFEAGQGRAQSSCWPRGLGSGFGGVWGRMEREVDENDDDDDDDDDDE